MGRISSVSIVPMVCALASIVACSSPSEPASEKKVALSEIAVPASIAATDTIRISFRYELGTCERLERYAVTRTLTGLDAAVFVNTGGLPRGSACSGSHLEPAVLVVTPPFRGPFTVRLQQPDGADSVRVVAVNTTP